MTAAMEEYAHRKNIERFESELRGEIDPQRRSLFRRLLDDESAKLDRLLSSRNGSSDWDSR